MVIVFIRSKVSEGDVLFSKDYIQPVCLAMRVSFIHMHAKTHIPAHTHAHTHAHTQSHAGSVELQSSASAVIMSLSSDGKYIAYNLAQHSPQK